MSKIGRASGPWPLGFIGPLRDQRVQIFDFNTRLLIDERDVLKMSISKLLSLCERAVYG